MVLRPAGRRTQLQIQRGAPVATASAGVRGDFYIQRHARQWRLHRHANLPGAGRIRHQVQSDGLVIEQQGVRASVVGSQSLAIERPGVVRGQLEGGAVQHDVALDVAQTCPPPA